MIISRLLRRACPPLIAVGVVAGVVVAPPAHADASTWTVTAPWSAGPTAVVRHDTATGTVTLAVTRGARTVLEPGPVGIVTEQADLSRGLRLVGRATRPVLEHYRTTVGKRLARDSLMTETRFSFAGDGGARVDLVVRAAKDGIAYRYSIPGTTGAVLGETSAFRVPVDATSWLATYRRDYENPFVRGTAGSAAAGEYLHPALFDVAGDYALLTESSVDGKYSGGRLVHEAGSGTYRVKLWDEKVAVAGPLDTPWRTAIVGDLGTVSTSTLVDDLAPSSKIADTSWIAPGKVFWSWLAGGREAGQSLAMQKDYVDYAAAHGWPYALVDAGWYFDPNWDYDPAWETTSWIPQLIAYAKARNVRIMLWIHFDELDTPQERESRLALFERWGVAGVKIDFMDSEAQDRFRWYDDVLADTARHHLLVNFHGSTLPHGIHRTWPHVMTMEAVHGGEKSSNLTTAHLTALPFTRNVPGSMDYTPMAWHRPSRPTSDAHELALAVVFESGLQNFAGRVGDYTARPEAERFLDQVPTVWDETRLLAGTPADSAVFARRSGDRWFIGGGYSGAARTAHVPLTLGAGKWLVEIVRDGTAGLVREQRVLAGGADLALDVPKDGGFAAIACRWTPAARTCDRPVRTVPDTTVTVAPATAAVVPGASFEVTGGFTARTAVSGVTLAPRVPEGWTVSGPRVEAGRVTPGQTLSGTWTITPPPTLNTFGYLDVPVVASFRDGRSRLEDEEQVRVHTWRPLAADWAYLSDLPFAAEQNGDGPVERDLANGNAAAGDGRGITIRRATYGKGLGAHAVGEVSFAVDGRCAEFVADVGVDDEAGLDVARQRVGGTVAFAVLGDGAVLAQTETVNTRTPVRSLKVDLTGVRHLTLRVSDGGDGSQNDHASWGDARVRCAA